MKPSSGRLAKRLSAVALGFLLAVSTPALAQQTPQSRLQGLQEQMFEFLQNSDYPGVLAVVREIRSLEVPVPESVLYAEGLSLLAIGRAQEAEWLLGNHLERASPDSLFYGEISQLYSAAQKASGTAAGGQSEATGRADAAPAQTPRPAPVAGGADPATSQVGGQVGSQAAGSQVGSDTQTARAQPTTGPLPGNIATEWELQNNPDAREWTRIRYSEEPRVFQTFLDRYPGSRFVPAARQRQESLIKRLGRRGYESYRSGDYAAARETWRTAADYGNDYAQTMLGFLYDQGLGVPQNSAEAIRWFEMAAKQGNITAQTNLGVLYYEGRGVQQDSRRALEWLLQGAEQGNQEAQVRLGTLYQYGRGNVPQNLNEAKRWFRLAADQGSTEASAQLRLLGGS